MEHPNEGRLQEYLDGELRPEERAEVESHLARCEACASELGALRAATSLFGASVATLDTPVDVEQARWRLEGRRRRSRSGARFASRAMGRAAVLLLASAAVLSATVSGSPVRAWLAGLLDGSAHEETIAPAPTTAPVALDAPAADAAAGVSVIPLDGRMHVVFLDPAEGVRLRVRLHDGDGVGVWADGHATGARFHTAPDRIEVEGVRGGEVRVEIPRASDEVTLEVGGRVYLRKLGERLTFPGPPADTTGPEILFDAGS
jgi:hypothetical protein